MIICLASLLLAGMIQPPGYSLSKTDAKKFSLYTKEGKRHYSQKQYQKAIKKFKLASKLVPRDLSVRYYLGMSAFYRKDFELATSELAKVVVASKSNSPYYKNALKCFHDYKKEFGNQHPYNCLNPQGKYFRWSEDRYPVKVFISHGLKLPKPYRNKKLTPVELSNMSKWLRSEKYVSKINRDKHYDDRFWSATKKGVAEWSFARGEKLIDFKLVKYPYDADIVIFWSHKLRSDKSALTTLPAKYGDKAIIQIGVDFIQRQQAHLRIDQVRHIAAHEFGHALGLNNSPFPRDIMYPIEKTKKHRSGFQPGGANRITVNDASSLRALYSLPGAKLK